MSKPVTAVNHPPLTQSRILFYGLSGFHIKSSRPLMAYSLSSDVHWVIQAALFLSTVIKTEYNPLEVWVARL